MSKQNEPDTPAEGGAAPPSRAVDPAALAIFLSTVAHDVRNPLGIVSESVSVLQGDFAAEMTAEHRQLATLADRGLRRLGRLADTISLAAALEAGTFTLKSHPVDLVKVLRAATATSIESQPRREVETACDLPEGPCRVLADEEQMARALVEIVSNAIRHARRQVRVQLAPGDGQPRQARISIEDDGQGVSAAARATLFRRFVGHRSGGGLALGLSVAHDVIVAHGGTITLEASTLTTGRPGTTGARFVISLALADST